jgi:hypothetical protein
VTDDHRTHIQEHLALLGDPYLRQDPVLLKLVFDHLNEHKRLLEDPASFMWLQITNQQPLQPPAPPMGPDGQPLPPGPGGPTATEVSQAGPGIENVTQQPPTGAEAAQEISEPQMPTPSAPFEDLPLSADDAMFKNGQ